MKPNEIDWDALYDQLSKKPVEELSPKERNFIAQERRFRELMARPCPSTRPRMMAIEVSRQIALAIERNPTSLRMWATDPETGVEVVARPCAASGGRGVLLGVAEGPLGEIDVYGVVRR